MQKGADLSILSYTGPGLEQLSELGESTYPGREISETSFLKWEYEQNPEGQAIINIARHNEKVISQYIVLPRTYSIADNLVTGSLSVNTLTHPLYRGKGLFKELAEKTFSQCPEKGIQFTVGFPNPLSHPLIIKKQLFETIGYLPLMIYPLHPLNSLWKYFSGGRKKTGEEIVLNISENVFEDFPKISLFDFRDDKDRYENFISIFNSKKNIVKNRSFQFLRWRYFEIPIRKYSLIKIEAGNEIKALAVFRAKSIFGLRCGIIVDFMSIATKEEVLSLLKIVSKIGAQNNLDLIFTTASTNSPELDAIKSSGFYTIPGFILPQKLAFIVRKHTNTCPAEVNDFKKWFLTFGDYDIF